MKVLFLVGVMLIGIGMLGAHEARDMSLSAELMIVGFSMLTTLTVRFCYQRQHNR